MTLRQMALDAARTLAAAGIDEETARRDVALLARRVLGWDAARWLAGAQTDATPSVISAFTALIARRAAREPVAYIVGEREFYGRSFAVTRDVLIPRPETELVVEAVLDLIQGRSQARVLDIGTGSGCLAITVAAERPDARLCATDASEAALEVARQNAGRIGVQARIAWHPGDLLAGATGPFDVIMSNPPYVPERDKPALEPEVLDYEPASALFAGPVGLDVIRRLVPAAATALVPGGWLVVEIGAGQSPAVEQIVRQAPGLELVRFVPDLQSIPRVLIAASHAGSPGL
jgi:release factor glutamine methyltransferase